MNSRVVGLAACEAVLVAGGLAVIGHQTSAVPVPHPVLFAGYVAALATLALLPRIHVENKRHACWITPADFALLIGLFALGPFRFLAAAMVAEAAIALKLRQPPLKTVFNLVSMLGGYTAAATTFALLGQTDPTDVRAWLAGVAALAAVTVWDILSTTCVFVLVEKERFGSLLSRVAPPLLLSLILSAALGLVALILFYETPFGALLLVPILGLLVMSTRGLSRQRAERVHFQRLYEASSKLVRLTSLSDTLARVAAQGRVLVTGSAAICCAPGPDGSWVGVLLGDDGPREVPQPLLLAIIALIAEEPHGEISCADIDRGLRRQLPASASMVWASRQTEPSGKVLLVVFRELTSDEQVEHRIDILTAFVAHAATTVANIALHENVQAALERQIVLNQQKSDFVAAVSHELRTPLAGMIGAIQTLQHVGARLPEDKRADLLAMGLTQGARLRNLIDDLLMAAAVDHQRVACLREPVVIADLFAELRAELVPTVGERLRFTCASDVAVVETDSDKLRRILINLVVNAGKYAPEGRIEVRAVRGDGHVALSVSDRGPGIPVQDRERVFERFVQLDQSATRRQGGTGLGLHLCRQLAGLLGGSLDVGDATGGGACFKLVLPQPVGQPSEAGRKSLVAGAA